MSVLITMKVHSLIVREYSPRLTRRADIGPGAAQHSLVYFLSSYRGILFELKRDMLHVRRRANI
jgi:hypothetical protein